MVRVGPGDPVRGRRDPARGFHARGRALARSLRLALRSRSIVVAQLVLYAAAGALSTIVPQAGQDPREWQLFLADHPVAGRIAAALGLDRIFGTDGFIALVLLSAASLATVLVDQWGRVVREWRRPVPPTAFDRAPHRAEFTRPAGAASRPRRWTTGRASDLGSPLFHLGLLVLIAAGLAHLLLAASAQVDLVEGDTLAAGPSGWGAQWPGRLAAPIALDRPIALRRVEPERYASGELRQLSAELVVGQGRAVTARVEVNQAHDVGDTSVHVGQVHGPAIYVEVRLPRRIERRALLLAAARGGGHEGRAALGEGVELRARTGEVATGDETPAVELRLLRGNGLLLAARLEAGAEAPLETGGSVRLVAARRWVRLTATRDPSRPLAYVGFAIVVIGAGLMFGLVRVDWSVAVAPEGEAERVVVAARPGRLAPLFRERFERLVARERAPS